MCFLDRKCGNTPCRNLPKMAICFTYFHLLFNLLQVACGAEFSMIVDRKGYLYSFGLPEYGQLGHNTDGKFFITSNKLSYQHERSPRRVPIFVERSKDGHPTPVTDVQIVDIACGSNHTVRPILRRFYTFSFSFYIEVFYLRARISNHYFLQSWQTLLSYERD